MFLNQVLTKMYDYQEKNNIKAECLTNTQFLYDYEQIIQNK